MIECRSCDRELTVDVRTYSCFPNMCADCVDRRLESNSDVGAIDRELAPRPLPGPHHRLELTPEQLEEIDARERAKSMAYDPMWQPLTREDLLTILSCIPSPWARATGEALRETWAAKPEGVRG